MPSETTMFKMYANGDKTKKLWTCYIISIIYQVSYFVEVQNKHDLMFKLMSYNKAYISDNLSAPVKAPSSIVSMWLLAKFLQ